MLFRISMKNLKKSIRDYSIYFFTLILGVCIFYVFNAVDSQTALMDLSKKRSDMVDILVTVLSAMSVVVSCILGFLIVYASRFLLRKRKKEFGLYLTLGMKKSDIARILLTETAVIGLISLAVGLLAGVGLSQFMSLFVANLFQADMTGFVFTLSVPTLLKTVGYFAIIYVVVIVMNTIVVMRSQIIDLYVGARKKEKMHLKNPWVCLAVVLFACVILGIAYYNVTANEANMTSEALVMVQIVLGIIGTFLVFWSVSGFAINVLKKIPGIYHRRLNSFIISETGSQINTFVAAASIICLLLFVTICLLSSAFTLKSYREGRIDRLAPIDVSMSRNMTGESDDESAGESTADVKNQPDGKTVADVLAEKEFDMNSLDILEEFVAYKTETVTNQTVMGSYMESLLEADSSFRYMAAEEIEMIRVGDYNRAAQIYGFDPVSLGENEYAISCDYPNMVKFFQSGLAVNDTIEVKGRTLTAAEDTCLDGFLMMNYSESNMGIIVVPDDIPFEENDAAKSYLLADYSGGYDTKEFRSYMDDGAFNRQVNSDAEDGKRVISSTRSYIADDNIGSSGLVVFLALYLGFVFIISGAAILALKEMSDAIDSREKYRILRELGVGDRERNRALFIQMGVFFGLPLILAVIHSVFGIQVCNNMMTISDSGSISVSLVVTALLIVAVYGGYFLLSYLCCRRVVGE